jgi:hypothetical protein
MTKFTRLALVATVLLTGATSAIAQTAGRADLRARAVTPPAAASESDPYAGHNPNSAEGNRAYWDYQGRHGN